MKLVKMEAEDENKKKNITSFFLWDNFSELIKKLRNVGNKVSELKSLAGVLCEADFPSISFHRIF